MDDASPSAQGRGSFFAGDTSCLSSFSHKHGFKNLMYELQLLFVIAFPASGRPPRLTQFWAGLRRILLLHRFFLPAFPGSFFFGFTGTRLAWLR